MPTEPIPVYQQNLSKVQKEAYEIRRSKIFKGTIAVCVIYAVIATLILLVTLFTNFGKNVLAELLFPFTITIIAGMILIVLILGIAVTKYKPPEITFDLYNSLSCPDYYKLKKVGNNDLSQFSREKQPYINYRCEADTNVYPTTTTPINSNPTSQLTGNTARAQWTNYFNEFNNKTNMSKTTNCDTVYPYLLANYSSLNDVPNSLQCEWSRQCNVPWSSVCPKLN